MKRDIALLVAEAPWFSFKDNRDQASGLPFFTGVKQYVNKNAKKSQLNIYSCDYYDNTSLKYALKHLTDTEENIQILYIGGHGDGKRVADASLDKISKMVKERGRNIKGLIVSSCSAASKGTLADSTSWGFDCDKFDIVNGPNWVISYKYSVYWFESVLLETAIIKEFASGYIEKGKLNSKSEIMKCFENALVSFDLDMPFAFDSKDNSKTLGESIRFWVRPQGSGSAADVTEELVR
ncbi:hypothetical protein AB4393_24195 [Vibrio splendidus]|uniref:hypothetical protein n=1 Tax=Vibrio splendidus TaxID=29497 RepID=UPI000C84F239|nr:hypothetical protein [Vibrio splendidus]PMI78427.1 hypothetical protein BCU37_19990 [Vibrio splendidus]PMK03972.1 hypothetical protein BCU10_23380 [Vibrio splendidus]PMK52651.1 hypothetical protein BCT96_23500 [Vibrio splendidus]